MAPPIKNTSAAAEKRRNREKAKRAEAKAESVKADDQADKEQPTAPAPEQPKADPPPAPAPEPVKAKAPPTPEAPDVEPPPVEAPPRVPREVAPPTAKGGHNWRASYGDTGGGGSREATCVLAATALLGALHRASERIQAAGIAPVFPPEQLTPEVKNPMFRAAVLTADDLLPKGWAITPAVELTIGGTFLTLQLLTNLKGIREAEERAKRQAATVTPLRSVPADPPPSTEVKAERPTDEPPPAATPPPSSPPPSSPRPTVHL